MEIDTNQTEHRPIELSWRLLAEVRPVLTTSLDPTHPLVNIAQRVVPLWADTCIMHIGGDGQPIRPFALTHRNLQQLVLIEDLQRHYPSTRPPLGRAHPGLGRVGTSRYGS